MSYNISAPPQHLSPYVQYIWQVEIALDNKKSFTHIATASSCSGLQFYFDGGFSNSENSCFESFEKTAIFHGQTSHAQDFITTGSAGIVGVKFYPYAIPVLFAMPAPELTNQMLTLHMLLGFRGTELAESIFFANSFAERVDLIVQFLTNQVHSTKPIDEKLIHITRLISLPNSKNDIGSLSKIACLSERQFERKFKELVGLSPKSYAKIIRFEKAKAHFETNRYSLTEVAISCGYYDQAHFNHDFKALSGYNPKEFYQNYSDITF